MWNKKTPRILLCFGSVLRISALSAGHNLKEKNTDETFHSSDAFEVELLRGACSLLPNGHVSKEKVAVAFCCDVSQ